MATKKAICRKCNKVHKINDNEAVTRLVCYCGGNMRLLGDAKFLVSVRRHGHQVKQILCDNAQGAARVYRHERDQVDDADHTMMVDMQSV